MGRLKWWLPWTSPTRVRRRCMGACVFACLPASPSYTDAVPGLHARSGAPAIRCLRLTDHPTRPEHIHTHTHPHTHPSAHVSRTLLLE